MGGGGCSWDKWSANLSGVGPGSQLETRCRLDGGHGTSMGNSGTYASQRTGMFSIVRTSLDGPRDQSPGRRGVPNRVTAGFTAPPGGVSSADLAAASWSKFFSPDASGSSVSYLVGLALDRFTETTPEVRSLLFLAGFAVFGLGLPLTWERWSWRMRGLEAAARLIRRKMPRFGDQLLGTVQLSTMAAVHPALIRAAMEQADQKSAKTDLRRGASGYPALPLGGRAGRRRGPGHRLCSSFLVRRVKAPGMRWATPWAPVERYTFADVAAVPGRLIVPYGEALPAGSRSGGKIPLASALGPGRDRRNRGEGTVRADKRERELCLCPAGPQRRRHAADHGGR